MPSARKRLTKPQVIELITDLLKNPPIDEVTLLKFAEAVNGGAFAEPKPLKSKVKSMTMSTAKNAVLSYFGSKTVAELRKNKNFQLSMTGETIALRSKDDWICLYRRWIGVPEDERQLTGPACINGINVLENFRPWHVFGLNPATATREEVKQSFRDLAKIYHPDMGGDPKVFDRLQKMRDSVLALMH